MSVAARFASLLLFGIATLTGCDLLFPIHDDLGVGAADGGGLDSACSTEATALGSYPVEVLKDGPVLYLRLGESSGPVARDETNHANGVYSDAGIQYGVPGAILGDPNTAVHFDGTARIAMPPGLDFQNTLPFTLEVWANEGPGNALARLLDHQDYGFGDAGTRVSWILYLDDANGTGLTLERRQADGQTAGSVAGDPQRFPMGDYHHAVATFDGTSIVLYVDAKPVASTGTGGTSIPPTGLGWAIGAENCGCTLAFIGALDEVAVYPTALTADRVCAHYLASGRR